MEGQEQRDRNRGPVTGIEEELQMDMVRGGDRDRDRDREI